MSTAIIGTKAASMSGGPLQPGGPVSKETKFHDYCMIAGVASTLILFLTFGYFFAAHKVLWEAKVVLSVMGITGFILMVIPLAEAIFLERHLGWWRGFFAYFFLGATGVAESFVSLYGLNTHDFSLYELYNFTGFFVSLGLGLIFAFWHFASSPKKPDLDGE